MQRHLDDIHKDKSNVLNQVINKGFVINNIQNKAEKLKQGVKLIIIYSYSPIIYL
jgi:hypothetical protein